MVVKVGCSTPPVCELLKVSSVKLDVESFDCQNTIQEMLFVYKSSYTGLPLNDPENAFSVVKSSKKDILKILHQTLFYKNASPTSYLHHAQNHPSTKLVAESSSWRRLRDLALDKGKMELESCHLYSKN